MGENVSLINGHIDGSNTCVICGRDIPEGSQVCVICGKTEPRDMVEVTRCKDCRIATEDIMIDGWFYCNNNNQTHKPDHFCSYGERRGKE